jgi:hypothetical protein
MTVDCNKLDEYIKNIKYIRDTSIGNKSQGDRDTDAAIIFLNGTEHPRELGDAITTLRVEAVKNITGELFTNAKGNLDAIIVRAKSVGNSTANNCSIGGRRSKRRSNRRKSSRKSKSKKSRRHRK